MSKLVEVRIYPIKRLNTEFEEIFNSYIAVYDEWHDGFIDSDIDEQVYYWYSENEFNKLTLGQMMDDDTIYLVDIDFENRMTRQMIMEVEHELV